MKSELKKKRFYEGFFKLFLYSLGGSLIFWIGISSSIFGDISFLLLGISLLGLLISIAVFSWGMGYHMYHQKRWGWFTFWIIGFFVGYNPILSIIFYIFIMSLIFKKGGGDYEELKPLKDGEKRCPHCKYNCPNDLFNKHLKYCDKNPDK